MKSFKNHLSVIIPLVALLAGIEFILSANRALSEYENMMNKD